MEQNKKRPRRGFGAAPGPLYPMALGGPNPKGGTEYRMRAAGNNHAFAFMEPAEPLQRGLA